MLLGVLLNGHSLYIIRRGHEKKVKEKRRERKKGDRSMTEKKRKGEKGRRLRKRDRLFLHLFISTIVGDGGVGREAFGMGRLTD